MKYEIFIRNWPLEMWPTLFFVAVIAGETNALLLETGDRLLLEDGNTLGLDL